MSTTCTEHLISQCNLFVCVRVWGTGMGETRWHTLRTALNSFAAAVLSATILSATVSARTDKPAPIRVKGSFVIAAICKDGIIVASDSRGTFKDTQGRRIAYYDTNQKIFPIGNNLIADTGYASLNDRKVSFLSEFMARFANSSYSRVEVNQLPASYFNYASQVLSERGGESAKVQTLVFAGFEHHKPLLCVYEGEGSRATKCSNVGYLSSPKQQIAGLEKASKLSFQEAARVMQATIEDYAAAVQPGSVGGPVVIRTITRFESRWFDKIPDWPHWSSFADLAEDYKNERVLFHLMPGIVKVQLDTLIEDGASWARAAVAANPAADTPVLDSSRREQ